MNSIQWTHVFTLLAIIVVADKRIYKEEVDSFIAQVDILKSDIGSETLVTSKLAFDWFVAQRQEIHAKVNSKQSDAFILQTINVLRDFPYHNALLRAMKTVSLADDELHVEEQSIMKLAAKRWGTDLSV